MIFDVDGTLVDSNDAHARAWVDAFAEHGITVAYDRVRRAIGMGGDKLMPLVSGFEEDSAAGKPIVKRRKEIFKSVWLPRLHAISKTRGNWCNASSATVSSGHRQLRERRGTAPAPGGRARRRSHPHPHVVRRRRSIEAGPRHREGRAEADGMPGASGR